MEKMWDGAYLDNRKDRRQKRQRKAKGENA
jgi:hypothetical protein